MALCYIDGWHYEVDEDTGEIGAKVFLDDEGRSYRLATETDQSWHERKHKQHVAIEYEDGAPALRVNRDEMAILRDFLGKLREERKDQ